MSELRQRKGEKSEKDGSEACLIARQGNLVVIVVSDSCIVGSAILGSRCCAGGRGSKGS